MDEEREKRSTTLLLDGDCTENFDDDRGWSCCDCKIKAIVMSYFDSFFLL
jgi:hypothetical protein